MAHVLVRSVHGELLRELDREEATTATVATLREQLPTSSGYFLRTLLYKEELLADDVELNQLPQPCELTLVLQTSSWSSELLTAAHLGDLAKVEAALRDFGDPDSQDERGGTALCMAACAGHLPLVQLLLKAKADPDLEGVDDQTPLLHAADGGHLAVAQHLVEQRCDIDKAEFYGETPLQVACRKGHAEIVLLLCAARANLEMEDDDGQTCLMAACNAGHTGIARVLLEQGADPRHAEAQLSTSMGLTGCGHGAEGTSVPWCLGDIRDGLPPR